MEGKDRQSLEACWLATVDTIVFQPDILTQEIKWIAAEKKPDVDLWSAHAHADKRMNGWTDVHTEGKRESVCAPSFRGNKRLLRGHRGCDLKSDSILPRWPWPCVYCDCHSSA